MKALAFVDLHGEKKSYDKIKKKISLEKPNFLICAGDFTIFENDIEKLLGSISKFDGKVFLIHGNHEEETVVRKLCKKFKNIDFVHAKIVKYKNLVIVGYGGGGFTIREVEFEAWVKTIRKELKKLRKMGKKIVFISHAPFYKTKLDDLMGEHRGNKSFTNFIKEFHVSVGICGHFHENFGKEDMIRKCRVYNPGPEGKLIEF